MGIPSEKKKRQSPIQQTRSKMNSFKVMRSEENSNNAEGPGAPTQSDRDRVYVSTKHWNTGRRRRKLADQMAGPFPIIARAGNAYRLQLPPGINVHTVVNPDYLRKDPNNPLSGQIEDPQPQGKRMGNREDPCQQKMRPETIPISG